MSLTPSQIQAMADTRRWHTRRVVREQSVAEHCHQVALLALHLAGQYLSDRDRADLLLLALTHDAHEPEFGDIPYPAKRAMEARGMDVDGACRRAFWGLEDPVLRANPHVQRLVDAADVLEAALYARRWCPGDVASAVRTQALEHVREHLGGEPRARALAALGEVER